MRIEELSPPLIGFRKPVRIDSMSRGKLPGDDSENFLKIQRCL
jgi:hypothetical protein